MTSEVSDIKKTYFFLWPHLPPQQPLTPFRGLVPSLETTGPVSFTRSIDASIFWFTDGKTVSAMTDTLTCPHSEIKKLTNITDSHRRVHPNSCWVMRRRRKNRTLPYTTIWRIKCPLYLESGKNRSKKISIHIYMPHPGPSTCQSVCPSHRTFSKQRNLGGEKKA
jgi:hypothetical protein